MTMARSHRASVTGFLGGFTIASLGGMIGLGGAEFRLPLLVGVFRLPSLQAVILNKATSLVVVICAFAARSLVLPPSALWPHGWIALNLLAGSLFGAWWAAGHAMTLSRGALDRLILGLLLGLGLLMLAESVWHMDSGGQALFADTWVLVPLGLLAGLLIGAVAAVLGVAGGELLIPTIVLLYGVEIKLAGSLSLLVSLPTMLVGFLRYRQSGAFAVLSREKGLFQVLTAGSVLGAITGGLLLGLVPAGVLTAVLGFLLLGSAWKIFRHGR